jgi:hypothetical protein
MPMEYHMLASSSSKLPFVRFAWHGAGQLPARLHDQDEPKTNQMGPRSW